MLAARARGLGTTITTNHLALEEEAAELLGIPFKEVMQTMLVPVAYRKREALKRGLRNNVSTMIHWDGW
jgi:nitroreductase